MINWQQFEQDRLNAAVGADECPVCGCVDCECELEWDEDQESEAE